MGQKRNISKYKLGIETLIRETNEKVKFDGEEKTKSIIKNHKDAFIAASEIIIGTFEIESSENSGKVDSEWYKKTIKELIKGGYNTIDVMEDAISSDINKKTEDRANGDITAKKDAFISIVEMRGKIDLLEALLKDNEEKKEFVIKMADDSGVQAYCQQYSE